MKKPLLTTLAILCAPVTALADGDVVLDLAGNSDDDSYGLTQGADGRIYAGATTFDVPAATRRSYLFAFDADGIPATTFGTAGRVVTDPALVVSGRGAIAVRPNGSVIAGSRVIATFSAAGAQQSTLHFCGTPCGLGIGEAINTFYVPADGRVYAGGGTLVEPNISGWTLARIAANGALDTTYGDGLGFRYFDRLASVEITRLKGLANGQFMAIGVYPGDSLALRRFQADGSTDFGFGTNGLLDVGSYLPFVANNPLAIDGSQRMVMGGGTNILQRRNANGSADNTYTGVATVAQTEYADLALDSMDRALVFGVRNDQLYVARLLEDGGLDPSFAGGDGEALVTPSPAGASVTRVYAGMVDSSDRPIVLLDFRSVTGRRDIALMRLTVAGVVDASFGAGVADPDVYPDAYSFTNDTAPFGTAVVVSDPVTPGGFQGATSVVLTATSAGSAYSVGCTGTYATGEGRIEAGQSICLRHSAPGTAGATATTTVSIGGRAASYTTTATATPADTTPDAFSFTDQTGVARSTNIESNTVTVSGITGAAPVSIENGDYSIGCSAGGFRSTNGTVTNGQTICVRVFSSPDFSSARSTTLAIGGVTDIFTATTLALDTTPDAFSFTSQSNLTAGSQATSNTITIAGTNNPAPISVTNGEYSINCSGTFSTDSGATIAPGATVCVRHTVAAGSKTSTLTIGGVSGTFTTSSTTSNGGGGGGGGGGGSMDAVLAALLALLVALRAGVIWRRNA